MKDGQKIPLGIESLDHDAFAGAGWWVLEVPIGMANDVFTWLHYNIAVRSKAKGDPQDTDYKDVADPAAHFRDVFVIAIRRFEDVMLFKLSWPECLCHRPDEKLIPMMDYVDG